MCLAAVLILELGDFFGFFSRKHGGRRGHIGMVVAPSWTAPPDFVLSPPKCHSEIDCYRVLGAKEDGVVGGGGWMLRVKSG